MNLHETAVSVYLENASWPDCSVVCGAHIRICACRNIKYFDSPECIVLQHQATRTCSRPIYSLLSVNHEDHFQARSPESDML